MASLETRKDRAVLLIGPDPVNEMLKGVTPHVTIGVDLSWDVDAQAWRADWPGGMQFGESKYEAAINGFKARLGIE